MKRLKTGITALALAATFGTAHAERDFAEIYKECGLGAMLFPEDPIIAVITNVTWDLGTTAVSSELSSPEMCKGNASTMAALILDAHPQIEQDLAAGEGEYLSSITNLMGCESDATAASELRASFSDAVKNGYFEADNVQKSEMLYNAAMSASCAI
jgi:hypothetical protein